MLTAFCANLKVFIFYYLQLVTLELRNLMPTLTPRHRGITKLLQCKYASCALQQINIPPCAARTKCGAHASLQCRTREYRAIRHPQRISGGESRFNRARLA